MTVRPAATESRLEDSDLANEPNFLIARVRSLGSGQANRALAALDLKVRHYSVLSLAASGVAPSQRELAEFLRLDPGQIVTIIDPLEERGLVERRVDATDRRNKLIVATPAGRRLYREARAIVDGATDETLGVLDAAERATLTDLLRRIAF